MKPTSVDIMKNAASDIERTPKMDDPVKIFVEVQSARWSLWLKSVVTPMIFIGVGVLVDSAAMQWMGFVFAVLLVFVLAFLEKEKRPLSIGEARDLLDRLESQERRSAKMEIDGVAKSQNHA